jgi:hypothetical protein
MHQAQAISGVQNPTSTTHSIYLSLHGGVLLVVFAGKQSHTICISS